MDVDVDFDFDVDFDVNLNVDLVDSAPRGASVGAGSGDDGGRCHGVARVIAVPRSGAGRRAAGPSAKKARTPRASVASHGVG